MEDFYSTYNLSKSINNRKAVFKIIETIREGNEPYLKQSELHALSVFSNHTLRKYYDLVLNNPIPPKKLRLKNVLERHFEKQNNQKVSKSAFSKQVFWKQNLLAYIIRVFRLGFFTTKLRFENYNGKPVVSSDLGYRFALIQAFFFYLIPILFFQFNTKLAIGVLLIFVSFSAFSTYNTMRFEFYRTVLKNP